MRGLVMLRGVFREGGWPAWGALMTGIAGCLALISEEWVTAVLMISLSVVFLSDLWEKLGSASGRSVRWSTVVNLSAGIGFLAVAFANAVEGDVPLTAVSALAGAAMVIGVCLRRRGQSARPAGL